MTRERFLNGQTKKLILFSLTYYDLTKIMICKYLTYIGYRLIQIIVLDGFFYFKL